MKRSHEEIADANDSKKRKMSCHECRKVFNRILNLMAHRRSTHNVQSHPKLSGKGRKKIDEKGFKIYTWKDDIENMEKIKQHTLREVRSKAFTHKQGIKYYIVLDVVFHKLIGDVISDPPPLFRSAIYPLVRSEIEDIEEFEDQIADAAGKLENDIEEFTENGSGWIFIRYAKLRVKMFDYEAIKGKKHLQLPAHMKNKEAVINVQKDDDKCFIWAILSPLHSQSKDPQRVAKYQKYMNELNCEGLRYPVKVQDKK